jgi:hypothetical protein
MIAITNQLLTSSKKWTDISQVYNHQHGYAHPTCLYTALEFESTEPEIIKKNAYRKIVFEKYY